MSEIGFKSLFASVNGHQTTNAVQKASKTNNSNFENLFGSLVKEVLPTKPIDGVSKLEGNKVVTSSEVVDDSDLLLEEFSTNDMIFNSSKLKDYLSQIQSSTPNNRQALEDIEKDVLLKEIQNEILSITKEIPEEVLLNGLKSNVHVFELIDKLPVSVGESIRKKIKTANKVEELFTLNSQAEKLKPSEGVMIPLVSLLHLEHAQGKGDFGLNKNLIEKIQKILTGEYQLPSGKKYESIDTLTNQLIEQLSIKSEKTGQINMESLIVDKAINPETRTNSDLINAQAAIENIVNKLMRNLSNTDDKDVLVDRIVQTLRAIEKVSNSNHELQSIFSKLGSMVKSEVDKMKLSTEVMKSIEKTMLHQTTSVSKMNVFISAFSQQSFTTDQKASQFLKEEKIVDILSKVTESLDFDSNELSKTITTESKQTTMHPLQQFSIHLSQGLNEKEQVRQQFVNQFFSAMKEGKVTALRNGQTNMVIRLNPDNLGSIMVKLTHLNGELTASIVTSNSVAKELLDSGIHQLRQLLVSQNISIDKIDVFSENQFEEMKKHQEQNQSQDRNRNEGKKQEVEKDLAEEEMVFSKTLQDEIFNQSI
ncbi:flagellar hook-length control protein FliK [Bacillus timonensis]|nr:flagellar hook-length control protein FliK [Bacillus timonensis]